MTSKRVRMAAADLDRLEPLWNSLREHYLALEERPGEVYERPDSWRRRRSTYERLLGEPGGRILALEAEGELVAYAALAPAGSSPVFTWSERATMIETFVVSDRHRGAGLGRALLEWVRAEARAADGELQLLVLPGNSSALEFYRAAGFETYCLLLSDAIPNGGADGRRRKTGS